MAKIPDISKFTDKIPGLVNSVKTMIDSTAALPEDASGDPIAAKIKELTELVKKTSAVSAEQTKDIASINTQLMALFKLVEAGKAPKESIAVKETSAKKTPKKEEATEETKEK